MIRPFNCFEKVGDAVVAQPGRETHLVGRHHKPLSGLRITAGSQAPAEQVVHGALERVAGAAHLFPHKASNIVVEGEGGSHIMMLDKKASRCQL